MYIISPYSHKLPNGKRNPKNFPWFAELVAKLNQKCIQIGITGEEPINGTECVFNASFDNLRQLVNASDTWISVDNFFPHFCHCEKLKSGIVIFGRSDPNLFSYPENINLLKDRKYLRPDQWGIWDDVEYQEKAFIDPQKVIDKIIEKKKGIQDRY
jgi:hypothetical protein